MRAVAVIALALSLGYPSAVAAEATLLTNATVVDVETGSLAEGMSVPIRDGIIVAVGDEIAPGDAVQVGAGGGFLIPGLRESHVHIFSTADEPETALPLHLISGITGIRAMGALWPIGDQRALQARIEAGEVPGPRLVLSGARADARPGSWQGMLLADTPDAARMRIRPAAVREAWGRPDFRREAMTEELRALAEDSIALDRRTFRMAHAAGEPILVSSDASFANPYLFHRFSLLDELDLHVGTGPTPREALCTATVAPPRFFGLADRDGTIAPGRRADPVLLDADPLDGLATLRRPRAVIAGGRLSDRDALDAIGTQLLAAGE